MEGINRRMRRWDAAMTITAETPKQPRHRVLAFESVYAEEACGRVGHSLGVQTCSTRTQCHARSRVSACLKIHYFAVPGGFAPPGPPERKPSKLPFISASCLCLSSSINLMTR